MNNPGYYQAFYRDDGEVVPERALLVLAWDVNQSQWEMMATRATNFNVRCGLETERGPVVHRASGLTWLLSVAIAFLAHLENPAVGHIRDLGDQRKFFAAEARRGL